MSLIILGSSSLFKKICNSSWESLIQNAWDQTASDVGFLNIYIYNKVTLETEPKSKQNSYIKPGGKFIQYF